MENQNNLIDLKEMALNKLKENGITATSQSTGINKGTLSGILSGKRPMSAERAALILDSEKLKND